MMSPFDKNPFLMPGLGQGNAMADNPVMAGMDMMRQAWASVAGLGGATSAVPFTPPMSPDDLDKRIAELKSIEGWLTMNLSMLTSTIQGMEVQRSTIATLRSFADAMGMGGLDGSAVASPMQAMFGIRPSGDAARSAQSASPKQPAPSGPSSNANTSAAAGAAQADASKAPPISGAAQRDASAVPPNAAAAASAASTASPASDAAKAWWDVLHNQFNHMAAAAVASMPAASAGSTAPASSAAPAGSAATSTGGRAGSPKRAAGQTAAKKKSVRAPAAPKKAAGQTATTSKAASRAPASPARTAKSARR